MRNTQYIQAAIVLLKRKWAAPLRNKDTLMPNSCFSLARIFQILPFIKFCCKSKPEVLYWVVKAQGLTQVHYFWRSIRLQWTVLDGERNDSVPGCRNAALILHCLRWQGQTYHHSASKSYGNGWGMFCDWRKTLSALTGRFAGDVVLFYSQSQICRSMLFIELPTTLFNQALCWQVSTWLPTGLA